MTVSLRLDEELEERLNAAAAAAGVSKSEFLRRCLTDRLGKNEDHDRPSAWDLGKDLFGCFSSESGDLSIRAKEIVREKIRAKYADQRRQHGSRIRLSSELTSAELCLVIRPRRSGRPNPPAEVESLHLIQSFEIEGWDVSVYGTLLDEVGDQRLDWDFQIEPPPERREGQTLVRIGSQVDDPPPIIDDPRAET